MDRKCMHEGVKKRTRRIERERGGGCSSDVINYLKRFPLLFIYFLDFRKLLKCFSWCSPGCNYMKEKNYL